MTIDIDTIRATLISHAMSSGYFEDVNGHPSENATGRGVYGEVGWTSTAPARGQSALNATSALVVFNVRVKMPVNTTPQDNVDLTVTTVAHALIAAYSGDFELGGNVRCVDLLGLSGGTPLAATAGYMQQDNTWFRIADITVPLIVNDAFSQAP